MYMCTNVKLNVYKKKMLVVCFTHFLYKLLTSIHGPNVNEEYIFTESFAFVYVKKHSILTTV